VLPVNRYPSRVLNDGRELTVIPLTFGRARLHIGRVGLNWYDDGW
jgi:hypothetical protein